MSERAARVAGAVLVGVATAIVIAALGVVALLNPVWVGFAQDRAEAGAWTGYTSTELRAVTDAILADLVVGPPVFDVVVRGESVLGERERRHMADVRAVFAAFAAVAVAAAAALLASARASRGAPWFWRAVRAGGATLAVATVAAGVVGAVAFDAAFEVFHRLFFAAGSYSFDPAAERLVQLFPQRFWVETSVALGAVIVVLSAAAAWLAGRRLRADVPDAAVGRARLEAVR